MEDFIISYAKQIIISSAIILILALGGIDNIKNAISKSTALFAFIFCFTHISNASALANDNHEANEITASNNYETDPWSDDNIIPVEQTSTADETINQAQVNYEVKPGDNLYSIAKQFAVDQNQINKLWLEIISLNQENIVSKNPNLIYPGEVITIPDI